MRQYSKFVVLQILRAYQWAVSPLFPPACRYVPTCSEYAVEAVDRYGVLRGVGMALGRLLRCHPFARGGYDPVVSKRRGVVRECQCGERPCFDCLGLGEGPTSSNASVLSDRYLRKA